MGKSTISMAIFHCKLLVHQRVIPQAEARTSGDFPKTHSHHSGEVTMPGCWVWPAQIDRNRVISGMQKGSKGMIFLEMTNDIYIFWGVI